MKFIPKSGLSLEHLEESSRLMRYVIKASLEGQLRCINALLLRTPIKSVEDSDLKDEYVSHTETLNQFRDASMKGLALDEDSIAKLLCYEELRNAFEMPPEW